MKTSQPIIVITVLLVLLAAGAVQATDEGGIKLTAVVETESEIVDAEGKTRTERVEAAKVVPGDEVIYTLHFVNEGTETAEAVVITNPVPEHMFFSGLDVATAEALVTWSVDGGQKYGLPDDLIVIDSEGQPQQAKPSDYTHVRWTLAEPLAPGAEGFVSFRAQLQ